MLVTVTLLGPAPWGFRITGGRDFGKPITVSKVTERGKAAAGDLRPGDVIVTINGESTGEMLNVEAQNKIKQSQGQLQLQVERSQVPPSSHTNGDTSLDRLTTRFQGALRMQEENQGALRASCSSPASLSPLPGSGSSQPLQEELNRPGLHQPCSASGTASAALPVPPATSLPPRQEPLVPAGTNTAGEGCFPRSYPAPLGNGASLGKPNQFGENRGSLSRQNSSPGSFLPPPPHPPSPGFGDPRNPWEMYRERRHSSSSPSSCNSLGSEPAMRRLEEDSEVYKMLQENRELRAAPRQSSTFRLLQEALEEEGGAPFPSRLSPSTHKPVAGVQKLHLCEKCGSTIATQAVRIQDGRYRHASCYACADCGLNLKMRGHFWAGDELYCEKHARLRYQGALGGATTTTPHVSPNS